MSTPKAIADLVVSAINGATLSESVTASFSWRPEVDTANASALAVVVSPVARRRSVDTRAAAVQEDHDIEIVVFERVGNASDSRVDELVSFAEEVEDVLVNARTLTGSLKATLVESSSDPLVVPEHIDERDVLTVVIAATYRVRR